NRLTARHRFSPFTQISGNRDGVQLNAIGMAAHWKGPIMKRAFLVLAIAGALSTAAVSANAEPAGAFNRVNQPAHGGFSSGIGSNARLDSIDLQQVVSQRQMAIQQTTSMLNRGCLKCIEQNIGR